MCIISDQEEYKNMIDALVVPETTATAFTFYEQKEQKVRHQG